MIRIFSIEDHWMVIDGLRARFRGDRDDISITCTATTMDKAIETDPAAFDLILLDLLIPGTDPVENVKMLKAVFPRKPIVILTSEERTVWEVQMCRAGVQAYLTKNDHRKHLKEIIKRVAGGEDLCKKRLAELKLFSEGSDSPDRPYHLKPTEKAILSLFVKQMTLKEIAAQLEMTESAVGKIMAKLRNEFNAKSNAGMILMLREAKII